MQPQPHFRDEAVMAGAAVTAQDCRGSTGHKASPTHQAVTWPEPQQAQLRLEGEQLSTGFGRL
jgi:hypothetical protein